MKKRNFLIPVATLLSVLSASTVEASIDKNQGPLAEDKKSISSYVLVTNTPFEFLMQQNNHSDVMAYHTSHSSHSSHRSHSSHYSSR